MTHETASNRRASERTHEAPAKPELERRYGSIGIPAVAAAARYLGAARRPAPTPATAPSARRHKDDEA